MPNVDQDTGVRHPVQPDQAIRKFREVDAGAKGMGCLGMQLTPLYDDAPDVSEAGGVGAGTMEGWLEVGMAIEVLGTGEHRYIPASKNQPEFQAR